MAGKAKSLYVTITVKGDPFTIIESKKFFTAKEQNAWLKEVAEKYPLDQYRYTKETY